MNKGRAAVILLLAVLIYGAGQLPSAPELNGTVSSVYSPPRQLEGRLDSSYLALGVFLAVAVVVLVVVVFAWRKSSRQSAGGYDVCG